MDAAKIFLFLAVYLQGSLCSERKKSFSSCKDGKGSLYDYAIKDIYDMQVPESFYKNHIDLVINVATYWGLTMQYKQLNELLQRYNTGKDSKCGFRVLAYPCNQFGLQEPGEKEEILNGLKHVRPGNNFKLDSNLKILQKIEVNGKKQNAIYTFLKVSIYWLVCD